MPKYTIYTEEIHKIHGKYIVEADSKEDAITKFNDCKIGFSDFEACSEDEFDMELIDFEVYEN